MSKVQVDKVVNLSDDGAPQLTYGAELPVGYGLTGAGGLNISGVVTVSYTHLTLPTTPYV